MVRATRRTLSISAGRFKPNSSIACFIRRRQVSERSAWALSCLLSMRAVGGVVIEPFALELAGAPAPARAMVALLVALALAGELAVGNGWNFHVNVDAIEAGGPESFFEVYLLRFRRIGKTCDQSRVGFMAATSNELGWEFNRRMNAGHGDFARFERLGGSILQDVAREKTRAARQGKRNPHDAQEKLPPAWGWCRRQREIAPWPSGAAWRTGLLDP